MGEAHRSVQDLAASLGALPPEFVRPEHEQPAATTFPGGAAPDAPVIDLSEPGCGARVAAAARDWGLFQVVNHGVPSPVVAELQRVGRAFFALPREEKERYAMDPASGRIEGYGTRLQRDLEGKKTWNDFFFHVVAPPAKVDHGAWPRSPPGYREANEAYCRHVQRLARELLGYLSLGLGLEEGAMAEAFGGGDMVFLQKINLYPPCPQPELTLGVAPHTDMSTLTVLVPNEVQGLQVFKDGHWYDAKYVPDALIVHIGDQIETDLQQRGVQGGAAPYDGEQGEDADVVAGVRGAAGGARRRAAPAAGRRREPGQVQGEEVQGVPTLQDQQAPHVDDRTRHCLLHVSLSY
ncbi:flavonol synthase/flavanone 3-hydroxylase [Panicum miliaceum]|uniref:Flavonol synthase/flavanone 3-hydroxylase n=1 Tax=Panicum miliaceum TaxID=4540 RepID=A0A3L6RQ42_PANMI|nr:flavonol synthase/flavanone 3-hydroxylase [Panicum miliaceum]